MRAETLDRFASLRDATASSPRVSAEPRVAALDGLRGFAVLAVMAYHGSDWASGGFLGVDIFFTLSGFLITSLACREHARSGATSLRKFYGRRALRLLPALALMLAGYLLVAALFDRGRIVMHMLDAGSALIGVANIPRALHVPRPVYIAPCWSLSVEWQFYLLWAPLLAWLLTRFRSARALAASIAVLAVGAWGAKVAALLAGVQPSRLYYTLDGRSDALLVGCALGALCAADRPVPGSERWQRGLGVGSTAVPVAWALLLTTARFDDAANHLWRSPFVAVTTALVIYAAVRLPAGAAARALSVRALVATGRVSYALYLWHYPIFLCLHRDLGWSLGSTLLVGGAVSFALAVASQRLVERPALALKHRFS